MNVAGIVAEYNIFHSGHARQIAETREKLGDDTAVVCCMSGNFVQRGDFAILEKHARARCALAQRGREGADLVLELPSPWALASAEQFAFGAVSLLQAAGVCTHLSFGTEDGDLAPLERAAETLEDPAFDETLRIILAEGMPYAAAVQRAAEQLAGVPMDILAKPNSILAVSYLRALKALGSPMIPIAVKRLGARHDEAGTEHEHLSASQLRALLLRGEPVEAKYLPAGAAEVLAREERAGRFPVTKENCGRALLALLRERTEADLLAADGSGEGLHRRILEAVRTETSFDAVADTAKTKRYARTRICRTLLRACLGIPEAMGHGQPPYLRVLAFNGRGREILREMREKAALPVLTRSSDVRRLTGEALELFELESRCTDLYALAYPGAENAVCGGEWRAKTERLP